MTKTSDRSWRPAQFVVPFLGAVAGFLLSALLLILLGKSVPDAFGALWDGSLGSAFARGNTLNKGAALTFAALSFVICFRARLISVGQEGQLFIGALASTAAVLALDGVLTPWLAITLALAAGALGGAAWGALAGVLKVTFGVNETISTLLLNFVAVFLVGYTVQVEFLLRQEITATATEPQSRAIPDSLRLPLLDDGSGSQAHLGVILAVAATIVVAFVLKYTVFGLRIRQLGGNPTMAARSGASPDALTIKVLAFSGAIAGLAGPSLVLGEQFRLRSDISDGIGFNGIAAALMGSGAAIGSLISAMFLGALRAGGNLMEIRADVNAFVVLVIQGVVIIFVAAGSAAMRGEAKPIVERLVDAYRDIRRPPAPKLTVEPQDAAEEAT